MPSPPFGRASSTNPGRATLRPRLAATKSARRVSTAIGGELSLSSGAELLAATRAAGAQHLAAARSRLAGEEAVPARANEVARLKSALHRIGPECNEKGRPLLGRPSIRCGRLEESQAQVKVREPRRGRRRLFDQ